MVTINSKSDLKDFTLGQLADLFNAQPGVKKIKKFRDRETAINRTWDALQAGGEKGGEEEGVRAPRQPNFNYPPEKVIRPFREGTKRAQVVKMLQRERGASLDEIIEAIGWDRRTAQEGIRLIHVHLGYGLRHDKETNRIKIYEKES